MNPHHRSLRSGRFRAPVWSAMLLLTGSISTVPAQLVADGATSTLSNVTNTFTGDVTVGTNGSFTLLVLSNNTLLTNSTNGVIGRNTAAKSNEVRLVSASAFWRMGGSLFVGSNGAMNRLVVSNGAFLENNNGILGSRIDSSNNIALITGGGSLWSNRNDLDVGIFGRNNQVIVSNGGRVANRNGRLGGNASGSNNLVLITGSGSVWSNALGVTVGNAAPGKLVIEAGGLVHGDSGTVGGFGSASSSEALVTGPGSLWTIRSFLTIGNNVGRNHLVVSNGATVWSGTGLIGATSTASSNQVVVTGAGSVWSNQTFLYLGAGSSGNRVDVKDSGWLACNDGYVGQSANSNTVVLTGGGSGWNNLAGLSVGEAGSGNVLIAINGATVLSSNATIGVNGSTANNNLALITGAGTLWSNRNDFVVGSSGAGNRLQVDDGATVSSGNLFVGFNSLSANNRIVVDGGTLRTTNAAGTAVLDVRRGTNVLNAGLVDVDQLLLTNVAGFFEFNGGTLITRGAKVFNNGSFHFYVGTSAGSSPAVWDVRAGATDTDISDTYPIIGRDSSFNRLVLTNGALLNAYQVALGYSPGANSNAMVLTGDGSQVSLIGGVFIGATGACNGLVVSDGAVIHAAGGTLGYLTASSNNEALVTGAGSVWTNRGNSQFHVGLMGSGNRLVISDGGKVVAADSFIGDEPSSSNNTALVTGIGSVWINRDQFRVGRMGSGNRVVISNGGKIMANAGSIGDDLSSSSNEVVVTDVGSLWNGSVNLRGSGGRLVISNGGKVEGSGLIGSNNLALVTGPGSAWNGDVDLGRASSLTINNGGVVDGNSSGFDGHVAVTGAGSVWNNGNSLGAYGSMEISSGGSVFNFDSYMDDPNTFVTVTGPGSVWISHNELIVGYGEPASTLVISNGAKVSAALFAMGFFETSVGNRVVIDGGSFHASSASSINGGTNVFNSGLFETGVLVLTNQVGGIPQGVFLFNGGNLVTWGANISNAANFVVGDSGTVPAVWSILGGSRFSNARLPVTAQITNGTYRPTNYQINDVLSAPAPSGPYGSSFLTFIGTDANGTWSLYIMDDTAVDAGSLASWSLQINTTTGAFTNLMSSNNIQIPDNGPASPYPLPLTVTGLGGTITNLTVTLSELSHTFPGDLDVLLVGPGGQKVMLMSDALGGFDLVNATLVFSDTVNFEEIPTPTTVSSTLIIGQNVPGCRLLLPDSLATLSAGGVIVGANSASTGNRVVISGGTLRATNASGAATFEVRRGTNVLNSGLMELDRLLVTSSEGEFEFNGGTLLTRSTTENSGGVFTVGNGTSPATLQLAGSTHSFFNNLNVANNASLIGNGTVFGSVAVLNGGILSPGSSLGTLVLNNPPSLQGTTFMEISKNGTARTNDLIQVASTLNYGGLLAVSNLGPTTLALGDRFQLFSAGAYAGSFSAVTLPLLNSGLDWTNKLLVDGSIEVVAAPPKFAGITVSGTNVVLTGTNGTTGANYAVLTATNVALPLSNWVSIVTNQFGAGGGFSFTNGFSPLEPQRYFRIRTP